MRTLGIIFASVFIFILCSCDTKIKSNDQVFKKSDNPNSLEYWTADTILKTNYQLVQLMDTLYQYVMSDTFPSEPLKMDITWMGNYRLQLCSYFDSKHSHDGNINEFSKADSVISEARALWDIVHDPTTWSTIPENEAEQTRLIFEQFNEYDRLQSVCKTEDQRHKLYTELVEWVKLEQLFSQIYANYVDLHYWGGAISPSVKSSGFTPILQSHIDLYRNEYIILSSYEGGWSDTGTFIAPARELFISCCEHALLEYYNPEENDKRYKELYEETQNLMLKLPPYVDAWIKARKPWEDEMSIDFLRPTYSRNTSVVLIKMANIISSVQ